MFKFLIFVAALSCVYGAVDQGVVILKTDTIDGRVTFTKTDDGIKVEGTITGLPVGKHGFHIHEKGDVGEDCDAAGAHFNPTNSTHGAPEDDVRHVGDLGNIEANATKVATVNIVDKVITLDGENSIIGRALVLHEGEDDLGKGKEDDSKTTGHAGARLACGVIGIESETADSTTTSTSSSQTSSTKDPDSKDSAVSVGLSFFVLFTTLYFAISNTV
ncbi:hypothetical protein MTP99_002531 [Tenebrio molitor]|jgi:Cu-Zn family superoxide dismutase|nr:hypothetical protein MTP99_002531 [Tenebrio molitor]